MYEARFKKWGLSKYMKASEKDKYLQAILQASTSTESEPQFAGLGESELSKLIRHLRKKRQVQVQKDAGPQQTEESSRRNIPMSKGFSESDRSKAMLGIEAGPALSIPLYSASFMHPTSHGSVDMQLLFQGVRASCCGSPSSRDPQSLVVNKSFWSNIKQAIYLFRISSETRAWPTLGDAYATAGEALRSVDGSLFVHEILATLSPANTKESPLIRLQIIQYLANMSLITLGDKHPITVVLSQLYYDDVGKRDVSERCMEYMIYLATTNSHDEPALKSLALDAQISIIRLLRKDDEHKGALQAAQLAHAKAASVYGPSSPQAISALRQQEHVHIDSGNHVEALETCFSIINLTGFGEKSAIHTMEDIAYIYEKLGNVEARAQWLSRAAVSAQCLWGESVATSHITDKILGTVA